MAARVTHQLESLLSDLAVDLVSRVGVRRKASPQYLALAVNGLCHNHNPCREVKAKCAYCQRRGNTF